MPVAARVLAVVSFLAAACSPAPIPSDADMVLLHGTVWDGVSDRAIPDSAVVVRGGRILAVGPLAGEAVPEEVPRIDLAGGFVLPGLIDNHVHVLDRLRDEPETAEDGLRRWLCAGVTTLVDNGSTLEALEAFASSGPRGDMPRIVAAGPIFTAPGGYPFRQSLEVAGPDQARAGAGRVLDSGASLIKAAVEAGFLADLAAAPTADSAPGTDQPWPVPTPATLSALATTAHERGALARAHVTQPGELLAALEAGFDTVAHTPAEPVPELLLHRAAEAGAVFVTTAGLWQADPVRSAHVRRNLRCYHRLGGTLALGTDAPGYTSGYALPVGELRALEEAGLAPVDVLRSATSNGARALGLGHDLGTLEPGKRADLLVVRGNPLSRLLDLEWAEWVLLDGEVVRSPRGCGEPLVLPDR